MKTILNCSCIAIRFSVISVMLFLNSSESIPQIYPWSPLTNITSGYIDKNPSFGTKQDFNAVLFDWEFMAFERHTGPISDICVLKMNISGSLDQVNLTNGMFVNTNPSIAYNTAPIITHSLAVWESLRNGLSHIYGAYYNSTTGWQQPFPIDTSASNKSNPRTINVNNSSLFALVYEKNSDIIFKVLDGQTHIISNDTNLTITDTSRCGNPFITKYQDYYVCYERLKNDNTKQIDWKRSLTLPNWSSGDTAAYIGNNINYGFAGYFSFPIVVFSSDRLGNNNIYGTLLGSFEGQQPIIIDETSDNTNYQSFLFPIITDGGFYYHAAAYLRKSDSIKVMLSEYFGNKDSVTINDTLANIKLTMNRGLRNGLHDAHVWVVFNKDSAGFSELYGKSLRIVVTGIQQISNAVQGDFNLFQNYPNPFNPVTKIRFDIPKIYGQSVNEVKLIIYDELGKEVEQLVNQNLNTGSYEVTWDAGRHTSGIYFYRLITNDYSQTRKLILLK